MLWENGFWYWYGENKEYTDGQSPIWSWGVRMYRSADLYNWEDLGLIAGPDLNNPDGNLFSEKHLDRPRILRCDATGKYVMWVKISGPESCFAVLQADQLQGPYETVQYRKITIPWATVWGISTLWWMQTAKPTCMPTRPPRAWQDLN